MRYGYVMQPTYAELNEVPTYGAPEAAAYLRLPYTVVRSWSSDAGLVPAGSKGMLSFNNLLEMHVLKGLRKVHQIKMRSIRTALGFLRDQYNTAHPLLDQRLETDGISLFLHQERDYINLSKAGQHALPSVVSTYLRRIMIDSDGKTDFYPFVRRPADDEPRSVQMTPAVAFGKPVLAGTGITTEVVAGRFLARDSLAELAEEYCVSPKLIEEALRWELPQLMHAA